MAWRRKLVNPEAPEGMENRSKSVSFRDCGAKQKYIDIALGKWVSEVCWKYNRTP